MNVWREREAGSKDSHTRDPSRYSLVLLLAFHNAFICLMYLMLALHDSHARFRHLRRQVPPPFSIRFASWLRRRSNLYRSIVRGRRSVSLTKETSRGDGRSAERRKGDLRCGERREHETRRRQRAIESVELFAEEERASSSCSMVRMEYSG